MIAKYLLFFWSNVLVLTPQDFRYSFKTCPALGGGTFAPFLLIWYSLAFSDQFTVFQSFTSSISCYRFPSTVLGTCNLFCCLGAFFALLLASSMVSNILPFFAFSWLRKIFVEPGEGWHQFFPGIFYIFLKFSLFFMDFFFASTGETFFVNPALGTMDIPSPKDFPSCSLHAELNSLSITDLMFFTSFFVGLKIFFSWKLFGLTFYFCGCLPSAHHTTCAFFEEATLYWCC